MRATSSSDTSTPSSDLMQLMCSSVQKALFEEEDRVKKLQQKVATLEKRNKQLRDRVKKVKRSLRQARKNSRHMELVNRKLSEKLSSAGGQIPYINSLKQENSHGTYLKKENEKHTRVYMAPKKAQSSKSTAVGIRDGLCDSGGKNQQSKLQAKKKKGKELRKTSYKGKKTSVPVKMDEIPALPCEANQAKLEQDTEVLIKNTYLMAFPSTSTIA
ncbi:hypothetical protein DV515_00007578 [Chloebia gouldiae]|uniref:Coiled-coil domain-containing protein 3 n=1 Tax=Chloebia gouldiae TaxID=44316 RepID=A0A3L8SIX8_CHLGU|nr:hypothetical protein DV515_00007578 [Chloebia gouldiae]